MSSVSGIRIRWLCSGTDSTVPYSYCTLTVLMLVLQLQCADGTSEDCVHAFCTYLGELEYQHKLPPARWAIPPSPSSPDNPKGGSSTSTCPGSACPTDRIDTGIREKKMGMGIETSTRRSCSSSEDTCAAHTLALHYIRDWAHLTSVRSYATWIQDILQRVPFSWQRQTPHDRLIPAWRRRMIASRRPSTVQIQVRGRSLVS